MKKSNEMASAIESRMKDFQSFAPVVSVPSNAGNHSVHQDAAEYAAQKEESKQVAQNAQPAASQKETQKEKTVSELLKEEGVVATEESAPAEEDRTAASGESGYNLLLLAIERIEGKLELYDQFRKGSDERIGDLGERIGELRQMLLDKERDFNEIQREHEKTQELVSLIEPEELKKSMERASFELEKRDASIESMADKLEAFSVELKTYRVKMDKIKGFENLVDSLNEVKKQVDKVEETKNYTDRIAGKSEHIFIELNEKITGMQESLDTVKKVDELTKELLLSIDEIKAKQGSFLSSNDLSKFREEINKIIMGATKEDFEKGLIALQQEVEKITNKVALMEFRIKSVSDLLDEKMRIGALVEKIDKDYRSNAISEKAYLESIKNARRRLGEIEDTLKRLDKEIMYQELNKLTKVVNEQVIRLRNFAGADEVKSLAKAVASLNRRLETSNVEGAIATLNEAKTNIFSRVGNAEKTMNEFDFSLKSLTCSLSDMASIKSANNEFEKLIAQNISNIDSLKGALSGMENKIEGELRVKVTNVESALTAQQQEYEKNLKLVKEEMGAILKEKLRSLEAFSEEVKALKDAKTLIFGSLNGSEEKIAMANAELNSLKTGIRTLEPKLSVLENKFEGIFTQEFYGLKAKLQDMEQLKAEVEELKTSINKQLVSEPAQAEMQNLKNLKRELADLRAELDKVSEVKSEINALQGLGSELYAQKKSIERLNSFKADIEQLKSRTNKLAADMPIEEIESIKKKVKRLEGDIYGC